MKLSLQERLFELTNATVKLKNLLPKCLQDDFLNECFLAGGSCYCVFIGKPINDFDFWCRTSTYANRVKKYFNSVCTKEIKERHIKLGTYKGHKIIVSDNAVSIGKYQIITRITGTPEEICGGFDFVHCMIAYENGKLRFFAKRSLIGSNELIYNVERGRDICGSIMRIGKFTERGFTIKPQTIALMLKKLYDNGFSEVDLNTLNRCISRIEYGENGFPKQYSKSSNCDTY